MLYTILYKLLILKILDTFQNLNAKENLAGIFFEMGQVNTNEISK